MVLVTFFKIYYFNVAHLITGHLSSELLLTTFCFNSLSMGLKAFGPLRSQPLLQHITLRKKQKTWGGKKAAV